MSDTLNGWTIRKEYDGWTLTDAEGDYRMIDGFGHISPTYRAAAVERTRRLEDDAS